MGSLGVARRRLWARELVMYGEKPDDILSWSTP